ncbi:MAG: sigma-70 family RNA polymerase sigma factor [Pseudomonadota bacterium]
MSAMVAHGSRTSSAASLKPYSSVIGSRALAPAFDNSLASSPGAATAGSALPSGTLAAEPPATDPAGMPNADFRALYDAHFRMVWATLSRLGVREEDLMDLTQKVFLTAYLKLPKFEGRSLFSTWLWGISRRVAIAHRRSAPICREIATDPAAFEFLTEEASHVRSNNGESAQQAQAILAKLTDAQRVVFLLFEVDRMNGREIATHLGIPLGTVRSRLRYAREVFRREVVRLKRSEQPARGQWSKQPALPKKSTQASGV